MNGNSGSEKHCEEFTKAFDTFYSPLFGSVYSKTGDFDDAEDICQEVFMRLFNQFASVSNVRAWIYGTMRIVLMEFYRKRGKSESDIDSILEDASLAYVNGFRETRLILEDAIESGNVFDSDSDRAVFDLVAVNCYTYSEAAKHLGITFRQARYSFSKTSKRIVEYFNSKGINSLEELL